MNDHLFIYKVSTNARFCFFSRDTVASLELLHDEPCLGEKRQPLPRQPEHLHRLCDGIHERQLLWQLQMMAYALYRLVEPRAYGEARQKARC